MICTADGSGTVCDAVPGLPTPEICDDLDNDCNGLVDDSDYDGDGVLVCDDLCLDEDATGFDADLDGCIDTPTGMKDVVDQLLSEGVIEESMANNVIKTLDNVDAKLDKENICAAINELEALINKLEAQAGKPKLSEEAATLLVEYTQNIINYLLDNLPEAESCP
jgi:hypothetical protein